MAGGPVTSFLLIWDNFYEYVPIHHNYSISLVNNPWLYLYSMHVWMVRVAYALHPSPWVQYSYCWMLLLYGVDTAAAQVTVAVQVGIVVS